jgi:aminodeoxyfutalosine synthase
VCGGSSADHKIDGNEWLQIARAAHELGLNSNCHDVVRACGDGRRSRRSSGAAALGAGRDSRVRNVHSARVHPENTALEHLRTTTGLDDLKNIAVSRLMLDNIPHVKAYWIMMTPKIAQIALRFGADDLDGTVVEEKIYHDAGATTSQSLRRGELLRLIRAAGREPVERDTLYRPVQRTETAFTVLV